MTLLTAGYWQTTYWAENYWNPDYWLHGEAAAAPEVSLGYRVPRRHRPLRIIEEPLDVQGLFELYLTFKLLQSD